MNFEIKNFFKHGFGHFGTLDEFKKTWLYSYFEDMFGEMIFLPYSTEKFITLDFNGYFFDEIYSNQGQIPNQIGTLIPKKLLKIKKQKSEAWEHLSKKGYYILRDIIIPENLNSELLNEKYRHDPSLPSTILFPEYNDKETPLYVQDIARHLNKALPLESEQLDIFTDSIKYTFGEYEKFGPHKYHMDYSKDLYYMYFYYRADKDIQGRELLVGERDLSYLKDTLDIKEICKGGEKIKEKARIEVEDNMLILLNTYNPKFVHSVEPLDNDKEVVLLTNYAKIKGA